jgi:hypothetical protein
MGTQIIQQPDGLFAVFSSDSDTIIVSDASSEEILAYFVDLAIQDTTRRVSRLLDHIRSGHPDQAYHQFALTWDEALAMDRKHGGDVSQGRPRPHRAE